MYRVQFQSVTGRWLEDPDFDDKHPEGASATVCLLFIQHDSIESGYPLEGYRIVDTEDVEWQGGCPSTNEGPD